MDDWSVIQNIDGSWAILCPKCGNRGGKYISREFAEHIASLSARLHNALNHPKENNASIP